MKDALGNPIVIGQLYGYSQNNNGFTNVKIGTVEKINSKTVTLLVTKSLRAVYSSDVKEQLIKSPRISPKSNMLFPVYEER